MEKETDTGRADTEWENRILCRDESCIGVIGPDGKCKECGLPYNADGTPPQQRQAGGAHETVHEETDFQENTEHNAPSETISDEEWQNRKLCSDGNCIGVIGPDGRCKECGKPFLFPSDD